MLHPVVILLLALILIVASSELFTNGVEWLGEKLGLSEGVVGSILAAVGTALPETLIPIVAVAFFRNRHGAEVGIGAIAGAPFMLSTLTLALCGTAILIYARRGERSNVLTLNKGLLTRDLRFFMVAYMLAVTASLTAPGLVFKWLLAGVIFSLYPLYVYKTFTHEHEMGVPPEHLHFEQMFKVGSTHLALVIFQTFIGLAGITGGAMIFVDHMEKVAVGIGFPPVALSLIVSPIATELPEKINSILWARNGKNTLALSNITGALVFQACFPVAFGVAFTPWKLDSLTVATAFVAICSALIYWRLITLGALKAFHLVLGAIAYTIVVCTIILTNTHTP